MEDVLGIYSPYKSDGLVQYEPYNGMQGHQLGQQMFDPKYHDAALMQELMKARAFDQILGAFTPQIAQGAQGAQGDGSNAYLDALMGQTAAAAAPAPQAAPPPAPAQAEPVVAENPLLANAENVRNDGYDAGIGGPDGYGLYSNHYAGTGMYNAPNESVTGFYSGQNSEGSKGEGGAAGK